MFGNGGVSDLRVCNSYPSKVSFPTTPMAQSPPRAVVMYIACVWVCGVLCPNGRRATPFL